MAEKILLNEGNSKFIHSIDDEDQVIIEFKDDESFFDGERKAKFKKKGILRNTISEVIYEYLHGYNIPTHFIEKISDSEMIVKKLEMIPISIHIRNIAAGSLCDRFNIDSGTVLNYPVIEYYLKDHDLKNPLILESHAYAFGYATPEEMKHISRLALKVNAVLKSFFDRRNLKLVDYCLEFGRTKRHIYLGDEISPDNARLWNVNDDVVDSHYFNFDNGKAKKSYTEIYHRLVGGES